MTTDVRPRTWHLPRGESALDSGTFPTREYDMVKEFVVALVVVSLLALGLAAAFSSPDEPAVTLRSWATAAPQDVLATAAGELAGTTTSATYGPPYNNAAPGQQLGPLPLQRWAGVQIPVDSADLVLGPLDQVVGDSALTAALAAWRAAAPAQQQAWAAGYGDSATAGSTPTGDVGPVPVLAQGLLGLARNGGLDGALSASGGLYGTDQTRSVLLLADGAYLEEQARARNLGGDQWGMMNETGNYPGQPWMWLYTFWYQVPPFSTSDNADALVWGLMMLLTAGLALLPWIPGLRAIPRLVPVHRLIWRRQT